jgi:hypothetical protein
MENLSEDQMRRLEKGVRDRLNRLGEPERALLEIRLRDAAVEAISKSLPLADRTILNAIQSLNLEVSTLLADLHQQQLREIQHLIKGNIHLDACSASVNDSSLHQICIHAIESDLLTRASALTRVPTQSRNLP